MCIENGKCKISDAKMNATRGCRKQKYDCETIGYGGKEFSYFLKQIKKAQCSVNSCNARIEKLWNV